MQQLIRKNIQALTPYSSARSSYSGTTGVFLDANELPTGTYNRYPDPYQQALKNRLAMIRNINADQIYIGNGSDEIIDIALRLFCEPGKDKALTFTPTYGMYDVSAQINNVVLIKLPLDEDFQIERKSLMPYLEDPSIKLLFLCSPNNPTGNLLDKDTIAYILTHFGGIVIIDEAYIDFASRPSHIEQISWFPRLIVSQTLSKAWGMAGLRLGIAYMHQDILAYYNKVKAPYNVSSINQEKALEVLADMEGYRRHIDDILNERELLTVALNKLSIVRHIYPSDTNFLLVQVDDADRIYRHLLEQKIIVRNRNKEVNGCIRITIGKPEENQQLITALKSLTHG